MLIPYSVDVPMIRYPLANWGLMGVIAIVSVGEWFYQAGAGESGLPLALKPGAFAIWQLFTSIFSHADIVHLAGNLLFLFVFGNAIDAKLGHLRFLACFLLCGIASGFAWLMFGDGRPALGASGAIMGLTGFFLVLYPRNDVVVLFWMYPIARTFLLSSWILIAFYFAFDLIFTFIDRSGGVAYVAHVGGACMGVAMAVGFLRLGWLKSEYYEENILQMLGWMEKTPRPGERKRRTARID